MNVLVTGANGFLGQAVCRILGTDHNVMALGSSDADLTRAGSLEALADPKVSRIYHLAARTQPGDYARRHKGEQFLVNQQIDLTVLTWWMRHQHAAKLITIGTSAAYAPEEATREENYLVGSPAADWYYYASAKRSLLLGQRAVHEQYGLEYLTVVPSALYGPGYPVQRKRMNFVLDITWKVLSHKHHGTRIILWGDGSQRREAVFIDDFVRTMLALDAVVTNEVVNVGAGDGFTIQEFADTVCDLTQVDPSAIEYDNTRGVGAKSKILNNEKLDRLLPSRTFVPLRVGLASVIDYLEPLVIARTSIVP